jgi:hypothetical protein
MYDIIEIYEIIYNIIVLDITVLRVNLTHIEDDIDIKHNMIIYIMILILYIYIMTYYDDMIIFHINTVLCLSVSPV